MKKDLNAKLSHIKEALVKSYTGKSVVHFEETANLLKACDDIQDEIDAQNLVEENKDEWETSIEIDGFEAVFPSDEKLPLMWVNSKYQQVDELDIDTMLWWLWGAKLEILIRKEK